MELIVIGSAIAGYLLVLTVLNFIRARRVQTGEQMMVASRSLSMWVVVFTLVCTWIGSGTFIAGAEYAYYAGWSSLWMPAGAWIGIAIIYFLAARIRRFGQYTVGDILEARYGKFARLFGAVAIIISFTTIVAYQFRAGGYIINVVTDGRVSVEVGQAVSALFVILFTGLGGMVAVAYTDLPNGIVILLACIISVPFVVVKAGGLEHAKDVLPAGHFAVFSPDFGRFPVLKGLSYCLSTLFLLLGIQSMYQKFYAARTPREAKGAVLLWIVGTIVVEVIVIVIAIYARVYDLEHGLGWDPRSMVLQAARHMVPLPVGVLLLGAATAVVISTGMNYLLSPSTNCIRDIYQRFIKPDEDPKRLVAIQKITIVVLGVVAFLMVYAPTHFGLSISVLQYAYFAYTIYGVAITPALIAALAWRRATKAGGLLCIALGTITVIFIEVIVPRAFPEIMQSASKEDIFGKDPFGIPGIFVALLVSCSSLIIGSLLSKPQNPEVIKRIFEGTEASK